MGVWERGQDSELLAYGDLGCLKEKRTARTGHIENLKSSLHSVRTLVKTNTFNVFSMYSYFYLNQNIDEV